MSKKLAIIPTGDEILNGTVLDTDSPEIKSIWMEKFKDASVVCMEPVCDDTIAISTVIRTASEQADTVVLIGGSGGGHRYDESLGKDFTHTALDKLLRPVECRSIYGPNGHLWCRLVIGYLNETIVLNVPGPFTEAKAAFAAFISNCDKSLKEINEEMANAVIKTYER